MTISKITQHSRSEHLDPELTATPTDTDRKSAHTYESFSTLLKNETKKTQIALKAVNRYAEKQYDSEKKSGQRTNPNDPLSAQRAQEAFDATFVSKTIPPTSSPLSVTDIAIDVRLPRADQENYVWIELTDIASKKEQKNQVH